MKSYPKYKPSSVDWIGDIPEHWELKTLRRITKEHRQGFYTSEDYIDQGVKLVRITDLHSDGSIDYSEMPFVKITSEHEKLYRIEEGDFLFPRTGTIGSLGFVKSPERAVFASYLIRFRFDASIILNRYLYYYFLSKAFLEGVFSDLHGGVNQNIHAENIKNQFIAHPIDEQQQIVDFLDYKTGQCDRFISNRQKQIELLNEQKATIINKAVTKGINPNAKMKPSGIDWIGDIPEHWEVKKIKRIHQTASGGTPNTTNPNYYGGNIPWLRTLDLNNGKIDQCEIYITDLGLLDSSAKLIPQNSILIAMYGGSGTIGKSGLLNFKAAINQAICAILPNKKTLPDFLYYFVLFYRPFWMIGASGARKDPNISQDEIKNTDFVFPPLNEQKQIVDFIEKETLKIETLISKYQKQIDLMQEYRTALISQAVTGKIDVREWKPQTK